MLRNRKPSPRPELQGGVAVILQEPGSGRNMLMNSTMTLCLCIGALDEEHMINRLYWNLA